MKLTALKSNTLKVLAAATLAGGLLTAAAPAAEAQWHVGVRIGGPVYVGPRYVAPPVVVYGGPAYYGYYGHRDDWRFRHDYRRDWRR